MSFEKATACIAIGALWVALFAGNTIIGVLIWELVRYSAVLPIIVACIALQIAETALCGALAMVATAEAWEYWRWRR